IRPRPRSHRRGAISGGSRIHEPSLHDAGRRCAGGGRLRPRRGRRAQPRMAGAARGARARLRASPRRRAQPLPAPRGGGRPGSRYVGHYGMAGARLATRFVVTAAERPSLHQVHGTTMGGWARWTTLIEPAGDGCVVRVALEYELPGELVGSLFGMLTGGRIER